MAIRTNTQSPALSWPKAFWRRLTKEGADGIVLAIALLIGLVARLTIGWVSPLWFDETFSGVIAGQPDFGHWIYWSQHELGGPVYYLLLWLWSPIGGQSDLALRLPSLLCSILAPLVIAWRGHPDRTVRYMWAALLALWMPGLQLASLARPYALLLLVTSIQAICFLNMMRRPPALGVTACWFGISVLAILTHYYAAVISGVQGIAYLWVWRSRAVRTWPAAILLLPMMLWLVGQAPILLRLATPANAWQPLLTLPSLLDLPVFLIGAPAATLLSLGLLMGLVSFSRYRRKKAGKEPADIRVPGELALFLSAVASIMILVTLGFLRPSFSSRYLTPCIPALFFGFALWARHVRPFMPKAGPLLVGLFGAMAILAIRYSLANPGLTNGNAFNFERSSEWLIQHGTRRIVFLWDSPTGRASGADQMAEVVNFVPRRAGHPMEVVVANPPAGADQSAYLLKLANAAPDTAILWTYGKDTLSAIATARPPRIAALDPRWSCRNLGPLWVVMLACTKNARADQP